MKKMFLVILMTVGLTGIQLSAQDKALSVGLKLDASMSVPQMKNMDASNNLGVENIGGFIGGFLKLNLTNWLALQPEIGAYNQSSKIKNDVTGSSQTLKTWGLKVPVYVMLQSQSDKGRMYIGIGPYAGYGLSGKIGSKKVYSGNASLERWDYGCAALLGYEFSSGWQINAGYSMGFANLQKNATNNASLKNQAFTIGVGYRF